MSPNEQLVQSLEPSQIWQFFAQLSNIPRLSGQEQAARQWIVDFAKARGLDYKQDDYGNLVVYKSAQHSTSSKTVCLQAHLDMVPGSDPEVVHDFMTDPIELVVDGDWLKAKGTTLGADDGIGVAPILAILDNVEISHPRIEALFTVEEESGLNGVNHLDVALLSPDYIVNLDYHTLGQEKGIVCVGSAGGRSLQVELDFAKEPVDGELWKLSVSGLPGGHSGVDIDKNIVNAIQLLTAILQDFAGETTLQIAQIQGGEADNAIPSTAAATVRLKPGRGVVQNLQNIINLCLGTYRPEYPELSIVLEKSDQKQSVEIWSEEDSQKILQILSIVPSGIISMSRKVPGLVQTSNNLGKVETFASTIKLMLMVRSDSDQELYEVTRRLVNLFALAGGYSLGNRYVSHSKAQRLEWSRLTIDISDKVEGWQASPESSLSKLYEQAWGQVTGKPVVVEAVHAGLECGKLISYYPQAEAISVGPELLDIHTTREQVRISSVAEMWKVLVKLLGSKM